MTTDQLIAAYGSMAGIRAFETRLSDLFLQGIVAGTAHFCVGQEACAVGICMALEKEDVLFSNHRGHGHLLARGADPVKIMAEIFGHAHGYCGGRGGSQHIAIKSLNFLGTHGITAGTIPLAVGAALSKRLQNHDGIAVVFFGDGAIGEGIFHESLNMAALWKLPVLFVCENNRYAMSSAHVDFSPVPNASDRAAAYGMKAEIVDGNDVAAVYAAAVSARDKMTAAPEPLFMELKTYRISGHSRGDQCLYRSKDEETEWEMRDPIERTKRALNDDHGWSTDRDDALHAKIAEAMDATEAKARAT